MLVAIGFIALVFSLFITGACVLMIEDGRDDSLGTQQARGKYRVLYEDGQVSQPFNYATARDYASMFNGKIVPRNYGGRS